MKNLAVILSKPLDADVGRNEKIKSRLEYFEERGWNIETYVIEDPEKKNIFLGFLFIFFKSLIVAIKIILQAKKRGRTVIWSMNSPAFLHLPALLARFFSGEVKWGAEFRDAMCTEPFYSKMSFGMRVIRSLIEGPTVKYADKILLPKGGKASKEYFRNKYPSRCKKIKYTAYQGYHINRFQGVNSKKYDKYTIVYAGRLYDDWITPVSFLKGFARFVKENGISRDELQILFYVKGWKKEYDKLADDLSVSDYLELKGFVPTDEIKRILSGADLLLYISGSKITNKNMIHSKFWDYIGSRPPLLVLTEKESEISKFVGRFNLGYVAEEYDIDDISDKLFQAYSEEHTGYDDTEELDRKFDRDLYNKRFYEAVSDL